jgi:hypothetical protein
MFGTKLNSWVAINYKTFFVSWCYCSKELKMYGHSRHKITSGWLSTNGNHGVQGVIQESRNPVQRRFGWDKRDWNIDVNIANGAVYTTIISTNVNEDKSILIYHHPFILQKCSATCFELQDIIRRTYKNSVLVLQLYFNIIITICFIFDSE